MPHPDKSAKPSKRFTDSDLARLERSDREQKDLRDFVNKRYKASEYENAALRLDSVPAFNVFWDKTARAQATFEVQHEYGAKRRMRKLQDFGEAASDTMRQLEPIVQAVKDFGYPFGGMAIGTIAFFFTIAQNKAAVEQQVAETLNQMRDRIAGFQVYERIYNDDNELNQQLQSQIVTAYETFVRFCIVSTKYYSRRGAGRWLRALVGPAGSLVYEASKVQSAIVDVRQTTEELLNMTVDSIKQSNIALRKQIEQMQNDHDSDRLNHVQTLLYLETSSRKPNWALLDTYEHDLDLYFTDWIYVELMRGSKLTAFKEGPAMQAWQQSTHSQMLLLVGYNHASYYSSNQCWLSPVALDMIRNLRGIGEADSCAFYLIGHREPRDFPHILSTLMIQLLERSHHSLRNQEQYAELCAELHSYRKSTEVIAQGDDNQKHGHVTRVTLQKVALRIFNMFTPAGTVWIIVDRVDRCGPSPGNTGGKRLLQALAQLVEKATVTVRILAVTNGFDWQVDRQVDELGCIQSRSICCLPMQQSAIG